MALTAPVILRYVVDSTGLPAAFGERQIDWLLEHGHIVKAATLEDRHVYRALDPDDARELVDLVQTIPELRECDFCRQVPTHWLIHVRPFILQEGRPHPERVERPMFACDVCARYIEANDKRRLVDYAIASTVEYARGRGGYLAKVVETHSWHQLKAHLTPTVREVVYGMFANRRGRPEPIEGSS